MIYIKKEEGGEKRSVEFGKAPQADVFFPQKKMIIRKAVTRGSLGGNENQLKHCRVKNETKKR